MRKCDSEMSLRNRSRVQLEWDEVNMSLQCKPAVPRALSLRFEAMVLARCWFNGPGENSQFFLRYDTRVECKGVQPMSLTEFVARYVLVDVLLAFGFTSFFKIYLRQRWEERCHLPFKFGGTENPQVDEKILAVLSNISWKQVLLSRDDKKQSSKVQCIIG